MQKGLKTQSLKIITNTVVSIAAVCFLQACGQGSWDAGVQNYSLRAANVFKADYKVPATHYEGLKYPMRRELMQSLPVSDVGLIDFLRLSQCELQRLVGERNSGLGKVIAASQLAFYTVQFITLAKQCLAQNAVPDDLIAPLKQAIAQKRQALPLILWNALIASPEFAQLHSLSDRANPSINTQMPSALTGAFEQLHQIASHLQQQAGMAEVANTNNTQLPNPKAFEQALSVIASSSYAGRLALQNRMLTQQLKQTLKALQAAWQAKPLCQQGSNGKMLIKRGSKEALLNVLHKYYIPEVQGLAVRLLKQSDTLTQHMQNLVEALLSNHSVIDDNNALTNDKNEKAVGIDQAAFLSYWQPIWGVNGTSAQLRLEIKNHTEFWQQVLKTCNLSPSA